MPHNRRSHCNEKPVHCNTEEHLLAMSRESPYSNEKSGKGSGAS